jgi:hypothetical protein
MRKVLGGEAVLPLEDADPMADYSLDKAAAQ